MDFGTTLKSIAPFFVPIFAMLIPIVAIVMGVLSKMRRAQLLHETVRQLAAAGREIPPQLLDGSMMADAPARPSQDRHGKLLFGAVNVAVGLGLMIFFLAMRVNDWLWTVGCIPLFVGAALLLVWRYEVRHSDPSDR
jgi:hypothetical protein